MVLDDLFSPFSGGESNDGGPLESEGSGSCYKSMAPAHSGIAGTLAEQGLSTVFVKMEGLGGIKERVDNACIRAHRWPSERMYGANRPPVAEA